MSTRMNPWRTHPAFTLLLVLDLLALLPQAFWLDPLTTVLLLALWGWAVAWRLGYLPLPRPWSKIALTVIIAALVIGRQTGVLGLQGGSALLAVMLLMKTLEIRSERDFYGAMVGLCFLLLSLLFRKDSWWMGGYVLLLALGLLALLWLITQARPGDRLLRQLQGARPLLKLSLQALPLALALFLLFPRLAQPLWGLPLDSPSGKTGLSEELSPGDLGELFLDDTPVFRASQFQPAMPPRDHLYWRAMVLWRFDGRNWKRAWLPVEMPPQTPKTGTLSYTLVNEAYAGNWLVSLDWPVAGDYPARFTLDGQWISPQRWQGAGEHHLVSLRTDRQNSAHPLALRWGLQLPRSGNPKTRQWAREQREKSGSPAAFVQFMLAFFNQENFYYSLSPPPLGENPVDEFLFQTRIGYCEHYASALAFAMRAAGIPARVVTGYLGGVYNPLGQYILVRKSDAHAWTEVWLEGQGWVRIDPTAAVAPERVQSLIRSQQAESSLGRVTPGLWLQQQLDWLAFRWNRWFLQYNRQLQQQLWQQMAAFSGRQWLYGLWPLLLWLLWRLLRWSQRRDRLLRQWQRLEQALYRLNRPPPAHLGPEALAAWARQHLANGAEVAAWIEQWLRQRYGPPTGHRPLPPPPRLVTHPP